MMDIRTRNPNPGDGWLAGSSRSAGLYGELPPLPACLPTKTAVAPKPRRKSGVVD